MTKMDRFFVSIIIGFAFGFWAMVIDTLIRML